MRTRSFLVLLSTAGSSWPMDRSPLSIWVRYSKNTSSTPGTFGQASIRHQNRYRPQVTSVARSNPPPTRPRGGCRRGSP